MAIAFLLILMSIPSFAQVQVFIFAGQSNMQGYGNRTQLEPVPAWAQTTANGWTGAPAASSDSGIQYQHPTQMNSAGLYTESLWTPPYYAAGFGTYMGSVPQLNGSAAENGSYGPELSFMTKWIAANPGVPWAAIKVAFGGTGITDFLPGGFLDPVWRGMITSAQSYFVARGVDYKWAGLIWMQGENGATDIYHMTNPPYYSDQLRAFLANIRAATSPSMPVIIGRIGNQMLAPNIIDPQAHAATDQWHPAVTSQMLIDATNFRRAQQVLVGGDPGNSWVDTDNLPVLQTGDPQYWYHFTGAGYLAMGERFYAGFSNAAPPPPALTPYLSCSITVNGVAQAVDGQTVLTFTGSPLRPVLSIGGAAVPGTTPWALTCTAGQQ